MADDNDPPKNPFIRWKQHVDAHIGMTLHGLLGIPNMVSKNLNLGQEPASNANNASSSNNNDTTDNSNNNNKNNGSGSAPSGGAPPPPPASSGPPPSSSSPSSANRDIGTGPGSFGPADTGDDDGLDGVDAAQLLDWHKFVYYSPYSPLKLQQQQLVHLLPPPVPQDVPFGADPFAFTYADAFEDLLRASAGRPLLDLGDRSYRNLRYQMRYGSAMEPPYAFFHRMHTQRLLDGFFPRAGQVQAANVEDTTSADQLFHNEESVRAREQEHNDSVMQAVMGMVEQHRSALREMTDEEDADKFGRADDDDTGKWDDENDENDEANEENKDVDRAVPSMLFNDTVQKEQPSENQGTRRGLFGDLDRVFRVLGRIIDESTGRATNNKAPSTSDNDKPSAEDELYDAVRSAYEDAERSLTTFIKSFSTRLNKSTTVTDPAEDHAAERRDGNTIQTTKEHVDAFGNRHVEFVVRRLDADGNEVSRETRYTIQSMPATVRAAATPATSATPAANKESDDDDDFDTILYGTSTPPAPTAQPPVNSSNNAPKSSGWFWK